MKSSLKVLFVFNRITWITILPKIEEIKNFFSRKVELLVDIQYTNFRYIPFETVETLDGTGHQDGVDAKGHTETVQDRWLDINIVPMAKGYDIVVFCISEGDKTGHITSAGIRGDRSQGPVECVIFGGDENYRTYINNIDTGNSFVVFTCHEISHAIYMILALPDNTHKYFYSGQSAGVLQDFEFPMPNAVDRVSIIKKLIALYQQLLSLITKKEMPKDEEKEQIENTPKIDLFCHAVQSHEGYFSPGVDHPKGSRSWRNNNPGNLKYMGQNGSTGKDSGEFAIFKDYASGYKALRRQVEIACLGQSKVFSKENSITQFFEIYAPYSDHNDSFAYAVFVADWVGVPVTTKMKDLL